MADHAGLVRPVRRDPGLRPGVVPLPTGGRFPMTRLEDLPDVLTVREVAAALRVSQSTVYELVRSRRLRAVRCGVGRQRGCA